MPSTNRVDFRNPPGREAVQPYYGLIFDALTSRSADRGDYARDPEFGVPKYVSAMCKQLAQMCTQRRGEGQTHVSVRDVLRVESLASGHCDYHPKLTLYVSELERLGAQECPQ